ncbi:MAG: AEC family transporter [Clostridia bacterium]|nr:AEC family transporter [Clostridia bacterium]
MTVDISIILTTVATMFFMLLAGFTVKKLKWVNDTTSKQITLILIRIGQPMLIISSMLKVEYSVDNLIGGATVFLIGIVSHTLLSVLAYFSCRWMKDADKRKICEFALIFSNCGFIGFPVLNALIGPVGVFYASFYVLTFNIFTWTWGMVILGRGRKDIKINPKNMILNFGTIPSFLGLILYVSRIPIPAFISEGMSSIGAICTPLSVILCGILLAQGSLKKLFTQFNIYYVSLLKLIVFPLIITVIAKFSGLPDTMVYIASIMSALPTAANTVMFAELYDIEQEYAAQIVGITTALCVLTVPLITYLAGLIMTL